MHDDPVTITRLAVNRGDRRNAVVFRARKKEMSRVELQRVLGPEIARWIKAACLWDDTATIGDHRFVVFSIEVVPEIHVYVQFWSEPVEPVLWEVSSGRWNPPADKWLAGDRSRRIEAFGFEIGGKAENYRRTVELHTPADAVRIARTVVDIFYAGFDYRGLQPVEAQMVYESRAEVRLAYDSFTPEDLAKIIAGCGFRVAVVDDDEDAPVLRAVRRGIVTTISCADRVPDQHLFRSAVLTSGIDVPPDDVRAARDAAHVPLNEPDAMQLAATLVFDGGVTVDWVVQRIQDWDGATWSSRKDALRRRKPRSVRKDVRVH
jgi:hypothetical protein